MQLTESHPQQETPINSAKLPFQYLIVIEPLGLLYGSAGRFLSPENLVGRSGTNFPPSAAALSGIFASEWQGDRTRLPQLQLAGPFWGEIDRLPDFYVPLPLHCLIEKGKIKHELFWEPKLKKWQPNVSGKFDKGGWVKISNWGNWNREPIVTKVPWKYQPHLHPRLEENQRRVKVETEREQGSLFLENGVQLDPDRCLVYLSNAKLDSGWYRFGGEGHLVNIECHDISPEVKHLLSQPVGKTFAIITPAVWGSNRHSYREPMVQKNQEKDSEWIAVWQREALLTERPLPFRYRLGNQKVEGGEEKRNSNEKLLSRGRYAMPAGSVYVLKEHLNKSWQAWPEEWFPKEGYYSFKRWGCGLALPLSLKEEGKSNGIQ
ncbi:MAG: type III-B CRISPR module-associated Cmr3 family protein [Phormidium sp.]